MSEFLRPGPYRSISEPSAYSGRLSPMPTIHEAVSPERLSPLPQRQKSYRPRSRLLYDLQNPFDENDNVEEILLNDNHNYELLDEYGLRVSGSRPEKKKNLIKRLLGAPLRKKDAAMEDDQGWTWGKMLFMIMVVVVVLGASASIIIVALIYSGLMKLKQ